MEDLIREINLDDIVVLEIGKGRGGKTEKLVELLGHYPAAKLITTDIIGRHFSTIRDRISDTSVHIEFIKTDALELEGISPQSVDLVVCNYTLCAISSRSGAEMLALEKFYHVLKPGGHLYIEEELPINLTKNEAQDIFRFKWEILRSLEYLLGQMTYREFEPEILDKLCQISGFQDININESSEFYDGVDSLEFFERRVNNYLRQLDNIHLDQGFAKLVNEIKAKVQQTGGMEIPYYTLTARK